MATKPYDKGSANESVPALTDSGAVSYPVGGIAYGTEGGTVTIVGAAGLPVQAGSGASFPVTDGGGSLTVDGTVAVSGSVAVTGPLTDTQLRASAVPVSLASTTITGTVAATQSGTWTVTGSGGTFPVTDSGGSLTVDAPVGTPVYVRLSDGTSANPSIALAGGIVTFGALTAESPVVASAICGWSDPANAYSVVPVESDSGLRVSPSGSIPFPVTDNGGSLTVDGTVAVSSVSGSVAVTGTFWQATQPVSIASTVTVTGSGGTFPVTDSGGSLTVDAPVGTPVFVRLSDGANPITTLPVVLAAAAGAGGPVRNATNYIDVEDPVMLVGGRDSGDTDTVQFLKVNSAGVLAIQDNGGSLTVDGTVAVSSVSGSVAVTGTFWQATQPVSLASVPSHDVTNAGTFAVQVSSALPAGTNAIGKLAANSGVTIGAVEIAATQTLSTVTTVSTLTGGGVAHDGVDSGNPVKVGARAISSLASATMVASADRTDAVSDLDGSLLVRSGFPLGDLTSERVSNTDGASTAFTNFGATASVRNYVTAITIFNSSATAGYVDFRDGTSGSILFTVPIPAGSGAVVCNGGVPLFRTSANTALAYDVSAALTTVYISVSGFRSKV